MFYFSKLKQLKEVLYDGLEKMPRKDGKTRHLIIYMLIVKPNITYLHSYNNTHGHFAISGEKVPGRCT